MEIIIEEDALNNFSRNAKDKLRDHIVEYAEELVKEASLIEEGHREEGAKCEITSNIVTQAAMVRRTMRVEKKTPKWLIICRIISTISCTMIGFFYDPDRFSESNGMLLGFLSIFVMFSNEKEI